MNKIIININPSIYNHIMFFLRNLPQKLIDIEYDNKEQNSERHQPKSPNNDAFGILKGKIKDPAAWQKALREESDRDICT